MHMYIRKATISDIKILERLQMDLHEDNLAHDRYLDLNWPQDSHGIAYYTKITTDPHMIAFIAESDGKPVGYIAGGAKNIDYRTVKMSEIYSMSVAPSFRSQGIGETLVNEFKEWAKKQGYQKVYVNVYSDNIRGIQFYKKCGLTPIDMSLETDV